MDVDKIRMVLGRLQAEPDSVEAWEELAEAVTEPGGGASNGEVERLLGRARGKHEARREWSAVAQLLDFELSFVAGEATEAPMQAELARVYQEELLDSDRAAGAYRRLLELRPDDEAAAEAVEAHESKKSKWKEIIERFLSEADGADDAGFSSVMLSSAADIAFRYGDDDAKAKMLEHLERALELDPNNKRAVSIAERVYSEKGDWQKVADVLEPFVAEGPGRDDRVAAGLRLGRISKKTLGDAHRAIRAYRMVLELSPGHPDALTPLSEAYSETEQWDDLVALYEEQLKSGGLKTEEELGILLQIALVNYRMREKPEEAEPYFDRIRRADPKNPAMLDFFRTYCVERDETARLVTILTDAQRSMTDKSEKQELATEIAKLAETQENAQKAIEQYKAVLRNDPDNTEARDALRRLYREVESWNALVEIYRQDLDRVPEEDRVSVLREIAAIYRQYIKNDQALVTILNQIVQADESDVEALRELARVYEALGRWRDLLTSQQKLAGLSEDPSERAELYRSAARRWLEQFSNVQNAVNAYEGLLEAKPRDEEAIEKLKELYQKRRAWAPLFDLYERQLEDPECDTDDIEVMTEMSRLAAERLDRGADAIKLMKRILELDPETPGIYEGLEKQAEREKDYATLAEVLEMRVESAPDDQARLSLLQKLGSVYADRLGDVEATTRAWKRVLEIHPGHNRALRVLREAYMKASDLDGLEQLYASQDDWEGLADFLSSQADKSQDDGEKVELSFRCARIYEEELEAPERATRSYERVLTVQGDDARAASALAPIYENEEKWARLPGLYEVLLAASDDVDERVAMLRKLAAVTGGPLSDKSAAMSYARRAYDLRPDAEGLELLEAWSRASSAWDSFVEAMQTRLISDDIDADETRLLRTKVAEVYAKELDKLDEAVATYKTLVEADPSDAETVATLDDILRGAQRKDDLRWLFGVRSERLDGSDKAEVLEEWATLEEEAFGELAKAAELYQAVVELDPTRGDALRALSRLLRASGEHAKAAEVIAQHRDVSEGDDRAEREIELAELYLTHLERPQDAYEAGVRALDLSAHHPKAVEILSRLVEVEETRVAAAAVLEKEYAETGDARREAQALRVMLESQADPVDRLALHAKLADVEEQKLNAPGTAFDVTLRALNEFPDDIALWDRAEDLSIKAGRPTDLSEAYRMHLIQRRESNSLSESVELELCDRAASLHDEKLGDPEGAMPYLERILAAHPGDERAFNRLKQILTASERWMELEALYDNAAKNSDDAQAKVELLNEVALIAEDIINDAGKAIAYYERILSIDELHIASFDALEKLYEVEERWAELADLLERRLAFAAGEETFDIKIYLGKIYVEKLLTPNKAIDHVDDVLRDREDDADARELCERLLEIGDLRQRAAQILETVYEGRDEIRNLVRVLDIRREAAEDDAQRRELLRRVTELRDDRLHDDAGAFAALSELVPLEPEDAESRERFLTIGRRLGQHEGVAHVLTEAADKCESPSIRGEILMEVARIQEDLLENTDAAESVYRRVIEIDPDDPQLVVPAARALGRIYQDREQHAKLAQVLGIEVKLEENVQTRLSLYERIGDLYETLLEQPAEAIEAWRARLSDEPSDELALTALERLYEKTEQHRELVSILHAREQSTEDQEERRRAMIKSAQVLDEQLSDASEAINAWRAVLDDFGPDPEVLRSLASLYERTERWADLSETLDAQLGIADETEERVELFARLGDCRGDHQEDLHGALDAYRQALLLEPSHEPSRKALERLLKNPDARADAAEILHPLYEADGLSDKLIEVLTIQVEEAADPGERLSKLEEARRTALGPLEDRERAFEITLRGVREAVGESDAERWIDMLEALAEEIGHWDKVCALYQDVVDEIMDGDVQQNVRLRIGELARDKLEDRELAIEHYKKAVEARVDDRRALMALEELYEETSASQELLDVLRQRVEYAEGDSERTELLFRMAELSKGPLEDVPAAIETYEAILDIELADDAVTALEELYRKSSRFGDLIALYERQLDAGADGAAALHVKIASVAMNHTDDIHRGFDELGEALDADPTHEEAVAVLEKVLTDGQDPEHRGRAGEMLEDVYLRHADWAKVKQALDARLEACQDPTERAELLQRLATLHEEQLEDYDAALETIAKLFHEDIADEGVWAELERLAKVAGAEKRLAAIYAAELEALPGDDEKSAKLCQRTGEIYADLREVEPALRWYRRAHDFEPESEELFSAIDELLKQGERHQERADLYRAHLDYRDGSDRLAALHIIAGLEKSELGTPEQAVETYLAALDVDDTDTVSLDALTELYGRLDRHRDLADLYERRADQQPEPEAAAPYRLALADLFKTKLEDTVASIDQLEQIVADVPWNDDAIKALEALSEDEEHKARIVEILRPLYERKDDWRLLVKLNEDRFHLADTPAEQVMVLRETAQLWEQRGQDAERAFKALRAAFDLDPEDGETLGELKRLAEALGAWESFAEALEKAAAASEDYVKRDLLVSLAEVYDGKLDDPRRALAAYTALSDLDPSDPTPLEQMDMLATLLADWEAIVKVLERKSEFASDEENASIQRRIAETKLDMLDDRQGAVDAYERALELEPDSAFTVDCLIMLYEPAEGERADRPRAERLVELYARRVELIEEHEDGDELRYDLGLRAAVQHERVLENPQDAIASLLGALDAKPSDPDVLAMLEKLYRAESMWGELLDNLKLQAAGAEDVAERVALRSSIGDLHREQLTEPNDALEQYRLVLDEEPGHDHAIKSLLGIGRDHEELRLDVADALEGVLRSQSRHEELVELLELRLTVQSEPGERAATLRSMASVLEEQAGAPSKAEEALLRALADTPDDASLHAEIERLAEATDGFERYADALSERAGAIFDAEIARDLCERLGRVAEDKLKDDRRAVEAYAKAVEHAGDEPELLGALDRLYLRLEDHDALANVLERRVELASGEEQAELYNRLAKVQIESQGDKAQGMATLRLALESDPGHLGARTTMEKLLDDDSFFEDASEVLEQVYRQLGDNDSLAALYERRIQHAPSVGERVRMRLDLARVLEENAEDPAAAARVLLKALSDEPADTDVLAELERLCAISGEWKPAADALEAAIAAKEDLLPETAGELWMRSASWRKDHAEDPEGAEKAFEQARLLDETNDVILSSIEELQRAPGREADLVVTLRRRADLETSMNAANEIRKEAKSIAQESLGDDALAETVLREMIAADDGDRWAMSELALLREKADDHKEVFDLLVRQAELSAQADLIRELRHKAAVVARDKLDDKKAAVDLLEQIFEDTPSDEEASAALRSLYADLEMHSELLALLSRLVDLAEEVSARAELRLEAAAVCDKLNADTEATEHLRAILEEDPSHREATLSLSRLLEKTGRDEELAELLASQIELARENEDREAEQSFRVRLGEVQETRLGDVDKAIATFEAVLEADSSHREALLAVARLKERQGEKAEAAKTLERVLEQASGEDAQQLSLRIADLFGEVSDDEGARRALERGLREDERAEEIRQRLRTIYERSEAWSELAEIVAADAEMEGDTGQKVALLAKAADIHKVKRKDPAAAAELLSKATELAPQDRDLLLSLCDAYNASGRGKQSIEVLQQIVESYGGRRSKDLAGIHHRLAGAYLAEGDKPAAFSELDTAFKIDPGAMPVLKDLGVLSLELADEAGDDKEKKTYIERAQKTFRALLLQKFDENSPITKAEVFYYLGLIMHKQGDSKKAIQSLERALDNDRELEMAKTLLEELKGSKG